MKAAFGFRRMAVASVTCLALLGSVFSSDEPSRPASLPRVTSEAVDVKFELLKSLHIAVPVKINDAGPFRLIFDLGSPINLVSSRAAAEAGLITRESAKRKALLGMRGEMKAKKFEIGDVTTENIQVMIMDHPTIEMAAQFLGPLDGIVGYPFFARYRFTIDYPASTMSFTPGDYQPQNVMQQMMSRMFAPRTQPIVAAAGLWGIEVEEPPDDPQAGVLVSTTWAGGAGEVGGLRAGDRILTIDGRWSDSPIDARDAAAFVKPGDPARVVIRRGTKRSELVVTPRVGI